MLRFDFSAFDPDSLHLPGTAGRLASSPVMRETAFEFKFERAHSCGLGRLTFEPSCPMSTI
jgi:hypothetical protein